MSAAKSGISTAHAAITPHTRKIILRTHMLMGQVYFFAMSREAILRRLGWMTLEGKNAGLVTGLLEENLEALFSGRAGAGTGEFPVDRSRGSARRGSTTKSAPLPPPTRSP